MADYILERRVWLPRPRPEVFEFFVSLNATDEQLDFPFIYASAKEGYAKVELDHVAGHAADLVLVRAPAGRAE